MREIVQKLLRFSENRFTIKTLNSESEITDSKSELSLLNRG